MSWHAKTLSAVAVTFLCASSALYFYLRHGGRLAAHAKVCTYRMHAASRGQWMGMITRKASSVRLPCNREGELTHRQAVCADGQTAAVCAVCHWVHHNSHIHRQSST
jgi:hypothetical protein